MAAAPVRLRLTRDRAGVNLWRRRPKYVFGDEVYFNGGETMTLPEDAFPHLHAGACIQVEVVQPE